jgi:membrane protease YdiL (CAAX protease family)
VMNCISTCTSSVTDVGPQMVSTNVRLSRFQCRRPRVAFPRQGISGGLIHSLSETNCSRSRRQGRVARSSERADTDGTDDEAGGREGRGPLQGKTSQPSRGSGAASTSPTLDKEHDTIGLLTKMSRSLRAFNNIAPKAPWQLDVVLTVMIMWIVSFWVSAYSFVPNFLSFAKSTVLTPRGVSLSYSGEAAVRHLLLDASQLIAILVLLNRALRGYEFQKYFKFSIRSKSSWVAIGCGVATFPVIDWLHRWIVSLVSGGSVGRNASVANGMFDGDGIWTRILWFLVLGVAAPLWEEVMFRGFLLPSLARATSPAASVLLTSLIFSVVHFTKEGFVPLLILGTVFGVSYCGTKNLFPAIMLHGLWNVCLLAQVMMKG